MPALQPINTQSVLPWAEAIDFTSVRDGGNVSLSGLSAGVYRITLKEAAKSNGVHLANDIRVTLGMGDVAQTGTEFAPKLRDLVAWSDAGETLSYVTLDVAGSKWLRHWVLTCRCPRIAYDLRQTATVKRPAATSTGDGLRQTGSAVDVVTNVDCRLQPGSVGIESELSGRIGSRRRFTLFLAGAVAIQAGDFAEVGGVKYEIKSQGEIETLGMFTSVECERTG